MGTVFGIMLTWNLQSVTWLFVGAAFDVILHRKALKMGLVELRRMALSR